MFGLAVNMAIKPPQTTRAQKKRFSFRKRSVSPKPLEGRRLGKDGAGRMLNQPTPLNQDPDGQPELTPASGDPAIVAIAADTQPFDTRLPWFRRDDIAVIADFIADRLG